MQGGVIAGSAQNTPPSPTDLQPGSMISLMLVQGDLNMNIDCTVTLRQGNNLYACGHQVLAEGPAQFPFAPAHVIVTVPSISSSFKVDAPGAIAGTIQQDRFDAIYGQVGGKTPPMIPVHVHLESTLNRKSDYNFEMIDEPFLSPILLNLATTSALGVTERSIGTSTLNLKAKIRLAGGQSVDLEDVLSSEAGTVNMAGATVAAPLAMLMSSGFPDLKVQDIDLSIVSLDEKRNATIEEVWSTKSEVRPGDHLEVTALLRLPWGANIAGEDSGGCSCQHNGQDAATGGGRRSQHQCHGISFLRSGRHAARLAATGARPEPDAAEQSRLRSFDGAPALLRDAGRRVPISSAFPRSDFYGGPGLLQRDFQWDIGGRRL